VLVRGTGSVREPQLLEAQRTPAMRELLTRAAAYTPEWSNQTTVDAGFAFARLFVELREPVAQKLNRLPEKVFVEFLRAAGISILPQQPARAMLTFAVDEDAPGPITLPQGFQVSVAAADGSSEPVTFETERTLSAAPLTLVAAFRQAAALPEEIDLTAALADNAPGWLPFGARPRTGSSLLIGFSGTMAARPTLALAIVLAAKTGAPPPVARGIGVVSATQSVLLRWDVLDGGTFEPATIVRDETRDLTQTGIVELRVPERWRAGTPLGINRDDVTFWLRVRLAHGEFPTVPVVRSLHVNAVEAIATRTIRDEVLEYAPSSDSRRMLISQTPVLPGSLDLVVIERGVDRDTPVPWQVTENLAAHGPEDRVFTLDVDRGELMFGDGVHGARLPRGFRHVVARSYQISSGLSGRVRADSSFDLVSSVPFVSAATNPLPASGGRNVEARALTLRRGPEQLRARGRAVTPADYVLLAKQVPGSDVARAHTLSGSDLRFPGAAVPGTVSVLLVSSDRGAQPPLPDAGTLESVAAWMTANVAPAGIQIVTGAPQFVRVGVRTAVVLRPGADAGVTVALALRNLQDFLHPLRGGDSRDGWPFGGVIRFQSLVRMLLDRTAGLLAVSRLNLVVDGTSRAHCLDYALPPSALIWPAGHEVIPVTEGSQR
jgi:hypothetical protein